MEIETITEHILWNGLLENYTYWERHREGPRTMSIHQWIKEVNDEVHMILCDFDKCIEGLTHQVNIEKGQMKQPGVLVNFIR